LEGKTHLIALSYEKLNNRQWTCDTE